MAELDAMYRMIILYMLDKVEYPLTNTQITNFILEKDYTNYFTVQQTLFDLLSAELITAESTHSNTRYRITDEGRQTLRFFADKVSPEIQEDIITYFTEHHYELRQETNAYADYYKAAGTGYQVRCRIRNLEQNEVDLTLAVRTREQAEAVCTNWEKDYAEVYSMLMDILVK